MTRPLILITNDDGIDSPGLHASASAVADLGDLLIVAPSTQQTGMGRSFPRMHDHAVHPIQIPLGDGTYHRAYKAAVSPAQAVALALVDLTERPVDLCISGINFGENVGSGVTASGTVGAALEASDAGIPSLAMSYEVPTEYHLSHSTDIDFSAAAHFTRLFAQQVLTHGLPDGAGLLKIDIPYQATPDTEWRICHTSQQRYYHATPSGRTHLGQQKPMGYKIEFHVETLDRDSDIYCVVVDKQVAVVPMSFDMTVHRALSAAERLYRG